MNFILDTLVFFRRENFKVLREFDIGTGIRIKEYSYGPNTYFTDTWPPVRGKGLPIKNVLFKDEKEDVTTQTLKFSGPMRNHVNVLALYKKKKRFVIRFVDGGFRVSLEEHWKPREGTVIVTDVIGQIKRETLVIKKHGDSNLPS